MHTHAFICFLTHVHAHTRRLYFTAAYFQPVMVAIWSGSILKQTNKQKTRHSYNVIRYFTLTSVNAAICVSHLSCDPQAENTKPTVHTMLEHALNIYGIWSTHMRAPLPFKSFTDSQNAIRCPHLAAAIIPWNLEAWRRRQYLSLRWTWMDPCGRTWEATSEPSACTLVKRFVVINWSVEFHSSTRAEGDPYGGTGAGQALVV